MLLYRYRRVLLWFGSVVCYSSHGSVVRQVTLLPLAYYVQIVPGPLLRREEETEEEEEAKSNVKPTIKRINTAFTTTAATFINFMAIIIIDSDEPWLIE